VLITCASRSIPSQVPGSHSISFTLLSWFTLSLLLLMLCYPHAHVHPPCTLFRSSTQLLYFI
jgi:hypothetical protein